MATSGTTLAGGLRQPQPGGRDAPFPGKEEASGLPEACALFVINSEHYW